MKNIYALKINFFRKQPLFNSKLMFFPHQHVHPMHHKSSNLHVFFSYLNKGSNADSCLSRVCITQVFLNFVSSAMASSFSVTASAEKVFLMNFSKGFLKSTPSERFNGRFIQPAIFINASRFRSTLVTARFFLPSVRTRRFRKIFLEVYRVSKPVLLGRSCCVASRKTGTLVPEVFLEPRREPRRGEKRKTSGYLGLETHFQAVARV